MIFVFQAEELRDVLGNDDQLWKWVAQYLVMKRASIEPNFHSLYAGFINTINVNMLYDTVLTETHRNIKVIRFIFIGKKENVFVFFRFFCQVTNK